MEATARAAKAWDKAGAITRVNWWSSPKAVGYYNANLCGEPLPGVSAGCRKRLAKAFPGRIFNRAVSVGCGSGAKEMAYLSDGLVKSFDLWEISPVRAKSGREQAALNGLSDRATFHVGNAFEDRSQRFDLVHWDHSLHHMPDVEDALRWSVEVLQPGGVILINDYIGPNRLQWTRQEVDRANAFLKPTLGSKVPYSSFLTHWKQKRRDPSEAPQSELIAPAVRKVLGVDMEPVGGTALNILGAYVVPRVAEDSPVIDELLNLDRTYLGEGNSHFVFVLWTKP